MEDNRNMTQKEEATEIAEMLSKLSVTERCTIRGIVMGYEMAKKETDKKTA